MTSRQNSPQFPRRFTPFSALPKV